MTIEQLTPQQQALIPVYQKKWQQIAFSTEPSDREKAAESVKFAYTALGYKAPQIVICDSPRVALDCIGQDSGIYWRLTEPLEKGAESPDWFYVPNVPPTLDGQLRRSYVMWQEFVAPWWDSEGNLLLTGFERADRAEDQLEQLRAQ